MSFAEFTIPTVIDIIDQRLNALGLVNHRRKADPIVFLPRPQATQCRHCIRKSQKVK
jgi:hypothetical protein